MDAFDYVEAREARPARNISALVVNLLTLIVLLGSVCVIAAAALIFMNPAMPLNPFPPPTLPAAVVIPTSTPTPRSLPPTWTPEPTALPTATFTPRPTNTPFPTPTEFGLATETPSPTVEANFSFVVQQGSPVAISSAAFHPDYGCAWMGVAGQTLDMSGGPVSGLIVRLGGRLPNQTFDLTTVTGTASQYGGGSFFEFSLADVPTASNHTLWLQLEDLAGLPLSDKIAFDTYADCDRNLIIINLKQVR